MVLLSDDDFVCVCAMTIPPELSTTAMNERTPRKCFCLIFVSLCRRRHDRLVEILAGGSGATALRLDLRSVGAEHEPRSLRHEFPPLSSRRARRPPRDESHRRDRRV